MSKKRLRKLLAKLEPERRGDLLVKNMEDDLKDVVKSVREIKDPSAEIFDLKLSLEFLRTDLLKRINILPTNEDILSLETKQKQLVRYVENTLNVISTLEENLRVIEKGNSTNLENLREELDLKIMVSSANRGGGSKPLQVSVGGTVANVRYADINLISSGATITNNDTTKKTDITFASSSSSGFQQPTSGVVDGSNATFVWATAPNVIVVDQGRPMQKTSSDGTINWTGTTTTILSIVPNIDIFASA